MPAPSAVPFTAAMTGAAKDTISRKSMSKAGRNVSPRPCEIPPVSSACCARSAPEQKARLPVPPITTARRSRFDTSELRSSSQNEALRAFRPEGRSMRAVPTNSSRPQLIVPSSGLIDQRDEIARLYRVVRLHVQFPHDAWNFGGDRDLHLHRLENDDVVALGDEL